LKKNTLSFVSQLSLFCSTACLVLGCAVAGRRLPLSARSKRLLAAMGGMVLAQTAFGVATLYSLVHVPVAAAHQIGSVLVRNKKKR
jgi:heme A synthase